MRIAVVLLSMGGVALVGLVVVVALLVLANAGSEGPPEVNGSRIVNAESVLREAERRAAVEVLLADVDAESLRSLERLRCGFSYPEDGSTPEEDLLCGPVIWGDSEPGTWLLEVPVSYDRHGDRVRATVGEIESLRTVAPKPGHEIVRPDGQEVSLGSLADGQDQPKLPAVPEAEPGDMGLMPPEGVMVDLVEVDDGELRGFDHRVEVVRSGWADRVRLQDDLMGPASFYAAPEGYRWLIFELAGNPMPSASFDVASGALELAVVADDDRFSLNDGLDPTFTYAHDATVVAVVVPEGADDVSLVMDDDILEQGWSFTKQEPSGELPVIFDRDPETLTAQIDQEFTLPYGARDLHPEPAVDELGPLDISQPFGDQELTVKGGEAQLAYGVRLGPPGVFGESGDDAHKASGSDRALLYLSDMEASWSDWMGPGYVLAPEDVVLTLADGTQLPATRLSGDILNGTDEFDNRVAQAVFYSLVWDVPADIETATVTATFRSANDGGDSFEIYFQEATIEMELDFAASS